MAGTNDYQVPLQNGPFELSFKKDKTKGTIKGKGEWSIVLSSYFFTNFKFSLFFSHLYSMPSLPLPTFILN